MYILIFSVILMVTSSLGLPTNVTEPRKDGQLYETCSAHDPSSLCVVYPIGCLRDLQCQVIVRVQTTSDNSMSSGDNFLVIFDHQNDIRYRESQYWPSSDNKQDEVWPGQPFFAIDSEDKFKIRLDKVADVSDHPIKKRMPVVHGVFMANTDNMTTMEFVEYHFNLTTSTYVSVYLSPAIADRVNYSSRNQYKMPDTMPMIEYQQSKPLKVQRAHNRWIFRMAMICIFVTVVLCIGLTCPMFYRMREGSTRTLANGNRLGIFLLVLAVEVFLFLYYFHDIKRIYFQ